LIRWVKKAFALQDMGITNEFAFRIVETMEVLLRDGGNFSINDAEQIDALVQANFPSK